MTENICSFCGKNLGEEGLGYCDNCYLDLIAVISELGNLAYHIENSQRTMSDEEILDELKILLKSLEEEILTLEKRKFNVSEEKGIIINVICPNCGSTLEWNSNNEPLRECSECGYALSIENEYKKNVIILEKELFKVTDSILNEESA